MTPEPPLSRKIARRALRLEFRDLPPEVTAKVKTALFDMLSCAFEARDLPWGSQAIRLAARSSGSAAVIGTAIRSAAGDAAFANATLAHGLVREDMHPAAVSHLGVVIFPALLALAADHEASGRDFAVAAVCGYEAGASVGRALMDQDLVRRFRPTGITGPLAAAMAGSRLLGLSEDQAVSALGLAANTTAGLNEWPYSGGDEMFFHPGFAARNAVTAVELAAWGAVASETALDGRSGLFAGLNRAERAAAVAPFSGAFEILSVYHKPAPACNYAQTACQAALALALDEQPGSQDIRAVVVKAPAAAVSYPGCNFAGPFERILQAKMSIQYAVAAALARRSLAEANYRLLTDPEIVRLAERTTLEVDPVLTAAYPGAQGAEVVVTLNGGQTLRRRLGDVVPATPEQIRARFRTAAGKSAAALEDVVETLERQPGLAALTAALPDQRAERAPV
ncbi:MAG TPA: MmgE/PrpD family protein [Bryobacteraceae bacterium]|nr:MmgE/PrpD family protein [Bryobacteraceae bacterium]